MRRPRELTRSTWLARSMKQDKIKKKVAVYSDPRCVLAFTLDMHRAIKEGDPKVMVLERQSISPG